MSTERNGHGQAPNGRPVHSDVSFEPTDVQTSPILKFLAYLGIGVVLSYLLALGVYKGLTSFWAQSYTEPMPMRTEMGPTMPPEPRLQGMPGHLVDPQQDYREKVKADTQANQTFAWVDEKSGIAQIPVKDAMQMIVEKGLPVVSTPPAETK